MNMGMMGQRRTRGMQNRYGGDAKGRRTQADLKGQKGRIDLKGRKGGEDI